MWAALKLYAKLNIILKNHIFAWFKTGKLSPWKILKDLTGWADQALTARGYKKLSELRQESQEIHDMMDSADGSALPSPEEEALASMTPREKLKPQERNRFGKLI